MDLNTSEAGGPTRGARVLLVDDDAGARRSMRHVLERDGWTVEDAPGVSEALERLRSPGPPFTVAVLDIALAEGESGIALAGTLHRENPELRFLFISGYVDLDVTSADVPPDCVSFLGKPLSITRLREEVDALHRRGTAG